MSGADFRLVDEEREVLGARNLMPCPVCRNTNLHLGPVAITQECDTITIGRGPKLAHNFQFKPCGRGARIRIRFLGECGHRADLILDFYKGSTFLAWDQITDMLDFPEGFDQELWRD